MIKYALLIKYDFQFIALIFPTVITFYIFAKNSRFGIGIKKSPKK